MTLEMGKFNMSMEQQSRLNPEDERKEKRFIQVDSIGKLEEK